MSTICCIFCYLCIDNVQNFGIIIFAVRSKKRICSGIEEVITSTTGNRVVVKSGTRVRIPPTAPKRNGDFHRKIAVSLCSFLPSLFIFLSSLKAVFSPQNRPCSNKCSNMSRSSGFFLFPSCGKFHQSTALISPFALANDFTAPPARSRRENEGAPRCSVSKKSFRPAACVFETLKKFQKRLILMVRDTLLGFPSHSVSKKPRRVCRPQAAKNSNHFLSRHVRERKYRSGCQCGICAP